MKKNFIFFLTRIIIPGLIVWFILSAGFILLNRHKRTDGDKRKKQELMLNKLNMSAPAMAVCDPEKEKAADEPDIAAFHDFLMTFDPSTRTVPRQRLTAAMETTRHLSSMKQSSQVTWQGYPSDMGGRTRAIMYDPNDATHKKVWAGGVTGGLWYNNNIESAISPWVPVGDFWGTLAIRCLAYDPNHPQTFFVGTGEVETAMQTYRESSGLGFGIGRSDDGGASWYHLAGTEQFAYVTDIVVRNENGFSVIYAGVASGLYMGSQHQGTPSDGLFRSVNGGATWQQVLPFIPGSTVPYCVSDIALGADNRLYVGTRPNLDGKGAAVLLSSDDGLQWTVNSQYQAEILASGTNNIPGRVVLGTAPSNENIVYALIASGYVNPANGFNYFNCDHILRSGDKGATWVKKSLPLDLTSGSNFATIAWHALDIAVDPNNANSLYIGGLDVHKSTDGGTSWKRVSDWSLMYSGGGPQYIHADQHTIVYKPGSSTEMLFGTDGGVFYTSGGTSPAPVIEEHNKEYSTLQYYTCAIHPGAGIDKYYGGLQDNGSLLYNGTPLTIYDMVTGGDGAYCFFDETDPAMSITSYYYNNYTVFNNGNFQNSIGNWQSGTFVSPADLDYKLKLLFCNAADYVGNYQDKILRLDNLPNNTNGTFVSLNTGSTVFFTALKYSPFSPSGTSTLFVGSESGRLFKVMDAQTNTPVVTEIGGTAFPAASISSIAIGKSEDTLMVTLSNYGVASVWITANGGQSWQDIEGNLPDMPVRWGLFHPQNNSQALLATETGVWECTGLFRTPVIWTPVNYGMANVRVDMLQIRKSDNMVLAATHGRGLFTMTWDISTGRQEKLEEALSVFPNPSKGQVRISAFLDQPGNVNLSVTNLTGKMVYQETQAASAGYFSKQVNIESLPKGTYLVILKNDEKTLVSRKTILY
ncbi:MAG: T9SS type A sorting domain-containing protein [Bacteroidetes bacterium]|nr:T9SS type A sorting domain-containing protein [Bacteroidota bacterium]